MMSETDLGGYRAVVPTSDDPVLSARTVGESLALLQHRARVTREELSELADVPTGTLSRYVNDVTGRPDPSSLRRILAALCSRTGDDAEVAWSELGGVMDRQRAEESAIVLGAEAAAIVAEPRKRRRR